MLLVGCGTCVTVCLAGGERKVGIVGSALRMSLRLIGRQSVVVDQCTIERQCEDAFIDALARGWPNTTLSARWAAGPACKPWPNASQDADLSGPEHPVHGHSRIAGRIDREMHGCGNCRLGQFAGICPITRCAKRQFNGPCGGSQDGHCEVNPDLDCTGS